MSLPTCLWSGKRVVRSFGWDRMSTSGTELKEALAKKVSDDAVTADLADGRTNRGATRFVPAIAARDANGARQLASEWGWRGYPLAGPG